MTREPLSIPEVVLFHLDLHIDSRGVFTEVYREEWLPGIKFVQDNSSQSSAGTLRGLHYQLSPKATGKYVRCAYGEILDVAVDIRWGSPTYGEHVSVVLNETKSLWIPAGFAHGFLALIPSLVTYKCTEVYDPILDRGIQALDPHLCINWGGPIRYRSERDLRLPSLMRLENLGEAG